MDWEVIECLPLLVTTDASWQPLSNFYVPDNSNGIWMGWISAWMEGYVPGAGRATWELKVSIYREDIAHQNPCTSYGTWFKTKQQNEITCSGWDCDIMLNPADYANFQIKVKGTIGQTIHWGYASQFIKSSQTYL